jgi:hypothetical protein
MVFVHPVHFFVADPDGSLLGEVTQFGGSGEWPTEQPMHYSLMGVHAVYRGMVVGTEQIGTEIDCNGVGYRNLPMLWAIRGS